MLIIVGALVAHGEASACGAWVELTRLESRKHPGRRLNLQTRRERAMQGAKHKRHRLRRTFGYILASRRSAAARQAVSPDDIEETLAWKTRQILSSIPPHEVR